MKTILDFSSEEALNYFLQTDKYCTVDLPKYFDFGSILNFVKEKIGEKEFDDCLQDKNHKPSREEDVNYKLLVSKGTPYAYRSLQLANPYLYYFLVREITHPENWKFIKNRFKEFKNKHVEVSGIPLQKEPRYKTPKAAAINTWRNKMEQRSVELSLEYKYVFVTDIVNCYESIYTHTIEWALCGREYVKQNINVSGRKNIGKTIEGYILAMQYRQSNGMPQGSVLFDFIAEMVLGYADLLLCERLKECKIEEYKILRYRDDYRIFSNSKEELEKIAIELQSVLDVLNFKINTSKTKLSERIIEASVKEDKLFYLFNIPIYQGKGCVFDTLQKELMFILQFSRQYPNAGVLITLLIEFGKRLRGHKKCKEKVNILSAILVEIAMNNPKVYSHVVANLSKLVDFAAITKREKLVRSIYQKFLRLPNIGHLQLWMQRLTCKVDNLKDLEEYKESLCRIVNKDSDVTIWNNGWLKSSLTEGFSTCQMFSESRLEEMPNVIGMDEVSAFPYN
ncbi:MAG: RNA-directed DNA polymerase [Bacteroides sp.]|nr:RNA-directed DNA polymerase [Bacteroides sp.]